MNLLRNKLIQPKSIILIVVVIAILVISSAVIELQQSRREMLALMEKQSHTLLETLLVSSGNALLSSEKLEAELKQRLLNNAVLIKDLFENNLISNSRLAAISNNNHLFRINIFGPNGNKKYSSNTEQHAGLMEKNSPRFMLSPIFNNEEDTLILGIKQARFMEGSRYVVAVASKNRDAVVVNVDADELINFRKQVGFGFLLREVVKSSSILYAILQDRETIIAAAGSNEFITPLDSSKVNSNGAGDSVWEIVNRNDTDIFEARRAFYYGGTEIGVFRLGLSMEPIENINARITRRIIIISILLIAFGSFALGFVFVRQNFLLLSNKFKSIEEYSNTILTHTGDAIILVDGEGNIKSANPATGIIFGIPSEKLSGSSINQSFGDSLCNELFSGSGPVSEVSCNINGTVKTLLVSKTSFRDENDNDNFILVIKDLTKLKELEIQSQRNEKLTAMGELSSAVAHEIRNPLNSISTIVQQLNKDFVPSDNIDEYRMLTRLVYSEVNRINSTVENFLKFARPLELNKEPFTAGDLLVKAGNQYSGLMKEKNIYFETAVNWNGEVCWDKNQIYQVFINLIENAVEAVPSGGSIKITLDEKSKDEISLLFSDTGCGMDRKTLDKIFDLYFTTRPKGNGIGLSIVQKIISAHDGLITVESSPGNGTSFSIILPKSI
jgi:PAS domain S-box-containing protein